MIEELNFTECLSVRQPWAGLIVSGLKTIENRTWRPPERIWGKRIGIHASLKYDWDDFANEIVSYLVDKVHELTQIKGAIIGSVIVNSHVIESDSVWFTGPFGWILSDPKFLKEPIPCKGNLSLWKIPEGLLCKK